MVEMQLADIPSALEAGRQIGRKRAQEQALFRAGQGAARGDYKGASNALFQYDPEGAMKINNYGQQQQQIQARQQAGTMAAAGDLSGAASTMAGVGDLQNWATFDNAQKEQTAQIYDHGLRIANGLRNVPMDQRKAIALQTAQQSPYASVLVPQFEQTQDYSDNALQAAIAGGVSVVDAMKQDMDARKLEQGDRRLDILEYNATKPSGGGGFGKAPSGYRYTADGNMEAVPGGPAYQKEVQMKQKADGTIQSLELTASNVLNAISTAEKLANSGMNTGFVGDIMSGVKGSQAFDMDAAIDTIVANIGFDKLAEMRRNSPTGGALGSVTERELDLLQSVVTSLRQGQSKAQFLANLRRVKQQYESSVRNIRAAYVLDFGQEPDMTSPGPGAGPSENDPLGIR